MANQTTSKNYFKTILKVLEHESEWEVTYEEVLDYLKESFAKMVTNLR